MSRHRVSDRMGIRAKLILSTCLPLLVIYVVVLSWDYFRSRDQALQQIEQLVAQRASADASQVDARLTAVQQLVNQIAYGLASRGGMYATGRGGPGSPPTSRPTTGVVGSNEGLPRDFGPPPGGPDGPQPDARPPDASAQGNPQRTGPTTTRSGPPGGFGPGGPGGGGRLAEELLQSAWTGAVWIRYESDAPRPARLAELFGLRRNGPDRRPIENFRPDPAVAAKIAALATQNGHGLWLEPEEAGDFGLGSACVFAEPFYAMDDGRHLGTVCASVPTDILRLLREDSPVQSQLRRMLGNSPTDRPTTSGAGDPLSLARGGYLLIDRAGRILSRPDGQRQGQPLAVGPDDEELKKAINRSLKGSGEIVVAGGLNDTLGESAPRARYVLAMEPLPATGWLYVTAAPESELLGPVQEGLIKRAMFLGASLLLLVTVVMAILTRFCRPIEQMARTVRRLAAGSLDIEPVPVGAKDELGQLAAGFNDMTGRLRHHINELTEQSAEREKVESELRIARQIQSDLLPRDFPPFPDRREFSLHAVNIPARHIAGDFFDYFFVGEDRLTVVIADVSGKGVPAALMMAVTRTMVRNLAEAGLPPAAIAERVNRMLLEDTKPGLFVTMVLGQYEPANGTFTYVNAGHPPAVMVYGVQAATCCDPTSPLLGVAPAGELGAYEQATVVLRPGATLLLYTDGVTEAHDESNVLFGEARLLGRVAAFADADTPQLCERVVGAVMEYQHQSPADDLTLLCLRRTADNAA